jgi:hypothetical protein
LKKFSAIKQISSKDISTLKFVRKIVQYNNQLLFATAGSGLGVFDLFTKELKFYNKNKLTPTALFLMIEMEKSKDKLWIGLNGGGVLVLDINTFKELKLINPGNGVDDLKEGQIWSFLNTDDGYMWVGTRDHGINKIDVNNYKITNYVQVTYNELKNNGVRCIHKKSITELLLGTEKGLFLFNTQSLNFKKNISYRKLS